MQSDWKLNGPQLKCFPKDINKKGYNENLSCIIINSSFSQLPHQKVSGNLLSPSTVRISSLWSFTNTKAVNSNGKYKDFNCFSQVH